MGRDEASCPIPARGNPEERSCVPIRHAEDGGYLPGMEESHAKNSPVVSGGCSK